MRRRFITSPPLSFLRLKSGISNLFTGKIVRFVASNYRLCLLVNISETLDNLRCLVTTKGEKTCSPKLERFCHL
jgi:hypothetical protein